jgi:electron transport complex protein RnfB
MSQQVYKKLCDNMGKRGGRYPGKDIPEFYALAEKLFTPEEASVYIAIPRGYQPAASIAKEMGKDEKQVAAILETMANKGLCTAGAMGEMSFYGAPLFVPGIFEFQFMKGTKTARDKELAKLIHAYKEAVDAGQGPPKVTYPTTRVIPVERTIASENTIHTYHQVASYIEKYEPISVSTCFCRHEAKLIDESDDCKNPDEVCMQFGMGAQFIIDRKLGRQLSKDEAMKVLFTAEEAGLVHASINRQDIDFICNCCKCHCMIIKTALAQEKPGLTLNSGFMPQWNNDLCLACEICIDRCPTGALVMGNANIPEVNSDQCIGCGVCATGCPNEAIFLVERTDILPPPVDQKALKEAVKASQVV